MLFKIEKYRGTHLVRVPLVAAVSLVVMVVGLSIMLWSAERGRAARLQVKQPGEFSALLPSIVGLTQASLDPGNEVKVLENGDEFFPSLLHDIANARESIHIE